MKPITWPQPSSPGKIESFYGVPDLNSATQGCVLDRIPVPCDILNSLTEAGGVANAQLINDDGVWKFPKDPWIPRGVGLYTSFEYLFDGDTIPAKRTLIATRKPLGLSDCLIEMLGGYFPGLDLTKVQIHTDGIPKVVEWFNTVKGGVAAVTLGNDIYYPEGTYNPTTNQQIALLGHELVHVWQYATLGKAEFAKQYATGYMNNVRAQLPKSIDFPFSGSLMDTLATQVVRFKDWVSKAAPSVDLNKAYEDIPLEQEATIFQDDFLRYLDEVAKAKGTASACP